MLKSAGAREPSIWAVAAAFGAVYVIWGSTYLGIKIAIETMPGTVMAGVRFLIAGAVLYLYCRMRGAARPSRLNLRNAIIVGALLLFGANGLVVWAEKFVPSGLTALLVSVLPVWMVLIEWLRPGGVRPRFENERSVLRGRSELPQRTQRACYRAGGSVLGRTWCVKGRRTVNSVNTSGCESTVIRPPWSSMSPRA
ncbi:MAG TPA: EamA family transporter, partial [Phycisphaerae bacterium]|nr:EamA family transporter [Phycisphaerae bacterium]